MQPSPASKKPAPTSSIVELGFLDEDGGTSSGRVSWSPGFLWRLPYLGIVSLLVALGCIVAGIIILLLSDGKNIATWGYGVRPSVYLSITAVVGNACLALALSRGVVIFFWRNALHGCTLQDMHHIWKSGFSITGALIGLFRRKSSIAALALFLATISVVRGPLNQQASIVMTDFPYSTSGSVNISIASIIPEGYTGIDGQDKSRSVGYTGKTTSNFTKILRDNAMVSEMHLPHSPTCGDTCQTIVKAFGFQHNCTIESTIEEKAITDKMDIQAFVVSAILNPLYQEMPSTEDSSPATIRLISKISKFATFDSTSQSTSTGSLLSTVHTCDLQGGIVNYNVILSNSELENTTSEYGIDLDWSSSVGDQFISKIDMLMPNPWNEPGKGSVIGGFQYAADTLFSSEAVIRWQRGGFSDVELKGTIANQYFIPSSDDIYVTDDKFRDPMEDMLLTMRAIAFRTSVQAAIDKPSESNLQTVPFKGTITIAIYVTNRTYMIIAAAIGLVGVVGVAATFWGWWELGREVSMSPLEIARAFEAPMLEGYGSNMSYRKFKDEVSHDEMQYGEVASTGTNGNARQEGEIRPTLAFRRQNIIREPRQGVTY